MHSQEENEVAVTTVASNKISKERGKSTMEKGKKSLNIRKLKKQVKGITLIALVVTIIVLLILAGIALNLTIGENGLFTRAQNAANTWQLAEQNEQNAMNSLASWMDQYLNGNGGNQEDDQGPIKISMKIEGEKVTTEPPLPSRDFTHIEGTVDTGYVIEDNDGNQFVWVPVDKNQKIKINVTSEANINSISLKDPYGDDITLPNITNLGTTYNAEVNPTINGPYVLKVTAGGKTKYGFLGVHSLYAQDTFKDWENGFNGDINGYIDEQVKEIEEAARSQGYSSAEEYVNAMLQANNQPTLEEMGFTTVRDYCVSMLDIIIMNELFDPSMKDYSETEDYTESVNNNGGFYIARYEASYEAGEDLQGKVASKKSASIRTSKSTTLTNGMLWNWIYQTDAQAKANEMYTSEDFTSSLPTGAAWDRTLAWLEETGAVSKAEIVEDSKTWGNYSDDTFSNTTGLINTGKFNQTEKNHIYDLAGNLEEWTTETDSTTSDRVRRGGRYGKPGSNILASDRRSDSPSPSPVSAGFRVTLYVQ